MYAGTYIIIVRSDDDAELTTGWYCLGKGVVIDPTTLELTNICCVSKFDPKTDDGDNTWLVAPVPGGDNYSGFFLQHQKSGLSASFGDKRGILLTDFRAAHVESLMGLNHVGNGWVTINNHSNDLVMYAQDPIAGTEFLGQPVIPSAWTSNKHQEWRLINTALFTGTPL